MGRKSLFLLAGAVALLLGAIQFPAAQAGTIPGPTRAGGPVIQPIGATVVGTPLLTTWGQNEWGQLGDGTKISHPAPVLPNTLSGKPISAVSAGPLHTCAVSMGRLYCWGSNQFGQLGNGTVGGAQTTPVQVKGVLAGKFVTAVSVGTAHTCAVANGKAFCWGRNTQGELGNKSQMLSTTPVAVNTDLGMTGEVVTAITSGSQHTCAVAGGKAYCWGRNTEGELGYLTNEDHYAQAAPVSGSPTALVAHNVTSIGAGRFHTCAVADGQVYCWGVNNHGQLGVGPHAATFSPTLVTGIPQKNGVTRIVKALSVGSDDVCVIAGVFADRDVFCWGRGADGRLGDNGNADKYAPVALATTGTPINGKSVSSVSIDDGGGCVIVTGKGYCWGDVDKTGRLGFGSLFSSKVPIPVKADGDLKGYSLLALTTDTEHSAGVVVNAQSFTDVNTNYPFYNDVNWLSGTGVTRGYDDGTYHPTKTTDRQAMAAFVFRTKNPGLLDPTCAGTDRIFLDVPASNQFCGAIEWLVSAGIMKAQANFYPTDPMSRLTMANWIYHATYPGVPNLTCTGTHRTFPDVPAGSSCGNVEWFAHSGVTTGFEDGTFRPNDSVNRDSMAAFFHRLQGFTAN